MYGLIENQLNAEIIKNIYFIQKRSFYNRVRKTFSLLSIQAVLTLD